MSNENVCNNKLCECWLEQKDSHCGEFLVENEISEEDRNFTLKNSCKEYLGETDSIILKQLTEDELRTQFESRHQVCCLDRQDNGCYQDLNLQDSWLEWHECARINNLLKEKE